jgi:hypothetical protein
METFHAPNEPCAIPASVRRRRTDKRIVVEPAKNKTERVDPTCQELALRRAVRPSGAGYGQNRAAPSARTRKSDPVLTSRGLLESKIQPRYDHHQVILFLNRV